MGSIEDNQWVDMLIDKIGFALTKVDESIQTSIVFWKELTKDLYDEQPTHDTTGQQNNVKSVEEDSSQDKSVSEVKERPIQHWAMCASKVPESLIRKQEDDEVEYNEEKEKEDDKCTFSESSCEEDMCELTLGTPGTRSRPNRHHQHNEEANTGLSLKWKDDGYEQLKDDDKSWGWGDDYDYDEEEDEEEEEEEETRVSKHCENLFKCYPMNIPLGYCYLPPAHPLHKENNALYRMRRDPYHMPTNDDTSSKKDDESWYEDEDEEEDTPSETSYNPSGYHQRNEEYSDARDSYNELLKMASLRAKDGYELLMNDDMFSEDDDEDSWNEDVIQGTMSYVSNTSLVDDDDDLSNKLEGFVDVKEEEVENKKECKEAETFSPECDWVYVTRD